MLRYSTKTMSNQLSLTERPRSSVFDTLPREILHLIVKWMPDVSTLCAAASSCRALHHVFVASRPSIIRCVLLNQLDESLLCDSLAAYHASLLPSGQKPLEVCRAIIQSTWKGPATSEAIELAAALYVSRLHELVQHFTHAAASAG